MRNATTRTFTFASEQTQTKMKTLHFSVTINAPKEKVWSTLWDDATYRKWTSAFGQGSYAVSEWKEGSKIKFMGANGDGIFSTIAKQVPNEFMAFRHMGTLKAGEEQPETEESKSWSGAMEEYKLEEKNGVTQLDVSLDTVEEFAGHFTDAFPKALQLVKSIAETESRRGAQ